MIIITTTKQCRVVITYKRLSSTLQQNSTLSTQSTQAIYHEYLNFHSSLLIRSNFVRNMSSLNMPHGANENKWLFVFAFFLVKVLFMWSWNLQWQKTYSGSGVVGVWFGALECPGILIVALSAGTDTLLLNSVFKRTLFFLSPEDMNRKKLRKCFLF